MFRIWPADCILAAHALLNQRHLAAFIMKRSNYTACQLLANIEINGYTNG